MNKDWYEIDKGDIGDSGCPCGTYKEVGVEITAHCWRTDTCCPYSGVHYKAKKGYEDRAKEKAREIAKYIRKVWRTDCVVKKDKP